jgi:hypothetical protein
MHPKLRRFSDTLDALFREVDDKLEDVYGGLFPLHPNRPSRGSTGSPDMDGLFEVMPDFSTGIGSEMGRGYIVSFRVATLERVPEDQFEAFMEAAAELIREGLPVFFPGRALDCVRDGKRFKIIGDFSLGEA